MLEKQNLEIEILKAKSSAKINFGLNIVEKRADGFHNIESIFYPVNLHDTLTFCKSKNLIFVSNNEILNSKNNNLVLIAVAALEKKIKSNFNIKIRLKKNIPIGAGLGGGSSNAAAVLNALIKIYNLNIPKKDLIEIAASIGADVPFFLDCSPGFVQSKGEIIKKIDFKISKPILIVNPGINIPTKWAYQNIKPQKSVFNLNEIDTNITNFASLKEKVKNDFEKIIFKKFPEVMEIKNNLYKLGSEFALMTGSGSTVFGIFPDLKSARLAEKAFLLISNKYFTFIHYEK